MQLERPGANSNSRQRNSPRSISAHEELADYQRSWIPVIFSLTELHRHIEKRTYERFELDVDDNLSFSICLYTWDVYGVVPVPGDDVRDWWTD